MRKMIIDPETPMLHIKKGHGRFSMSVDKDTVEGFMVFCCSDKCAPDLGVNVKLPEDEKPVSVFALALSDYRQAEAYSQAFHLLANMMQLRAGQN